MPRPIWSPPKIPARRTGWENAYVEAVERHMAQPFAWGVSDCLIVPADVCRAMTGRNPFPMRLRRYRTAGGAARLLARLRLGDAEGALAAVFPRIPPGMARRGDCGIAVRQVEGKTVKSAVVVLGNGTAMGKGPEGPEMVPVLELTAAFAVGWSG